SSRHSEYALPETPPPSDDESVECRRCLADTPPEDVITVEHCGHLICRDCMRRTTINQTGNTALCPATLEDGTLCCSRVQDTALRPMSMN
ncbi:hypothetical protein MTO96_032058, partial [Rhipicephalus appendiculatus]